MGENLKEQNASPVESNPQVAKRKRSRWFLFSLLLNVILLIWAMGATYEARYIIHGWLLKHRTNRVVFVGDSLTQAAENWDHRLGRWDTLNYGYGGFVVPHIKHVVQVRIINQLNPKPRCCFVMGGINDIGLGLDINITKESYGELLDALRQAGITPVIELTLYRQPGTLSDSVDDLNDFLLAYAKEHNVPVLDLRPRLTENRKLKAEYTTDGIHLNESAYIIWAEEVNRILKDLNI